MSSRVVALSDNSCQWLRCRCSWGGANSEICSWLWRASTDLPSSQAVLVSSSTNAKPEGGNSGGSCWCRCSCYASLSKSQWKAWNINAQNDQRYGSRSGCASNSRVSRKTCSVGASGSLSTIISCRTYVNPTLNLPSCCVIGLQDIPARVLCTALKTNSLMCPTLFATEKIPA